MSEKVPYAYVEHKIKESPKYQRAIKMWGKPVVDNVAIPHLIYLFNIFKEHGLLHLRAKKDNMFRQVEVLFGNNPIGISLEQDVKAVQKKKDSQRVVEVNLKDETVEKVVRKRRAVRKRRVGRKRFRHFFEKYLKKMRVY